MGRQVAGKEFLDAYLTHGNWDELVALVRDDKSGSALLSACSNHPSSQRQKRRLRLYQWQDFRDEFLCEAPASPIYFPCPPDSRYAWMRQHAGNAPFALCGVTHTLCSLNAVQALTGLLTAPFESYDRLICTSQAVVDMVRSVTDTYADYLRDRFGGQPCLRTPLELIPLGVNTTTFQPASPAERARERGRLKIREDEVVVLFVGRLTHHAKAHPFPMYRGLELAAERCGKPVRLLLAGWAPSRTVMDAFEDGARKFAPNVRLTVVDGTKPENRHAVWKAADIFTSLSDNIQETFGLVIVEAMASGLPVVATDWNGYRDLAVDGETGFLTPTVMVEQATRDLTLMLLTGEIDYDHFLARSNQAVAVDVQAAAEAFARLIEDESLRKAMGRAGRRRAEQLFDWSHIIPKYQSLWATQEKELFLSVASKTTARRPTPSAYPPLETAFAGYPSRWLDEGSRVIAASGAADRLPQLRDTPLTNYEPSPRIEDLALLRQLLEVSAQGATVGEMERTLSQHPPSMVRATVAWMLKYDLLRTSPS